MKEAPKEIPPEMRDQFLMNGKMKLLDQYINQASEDVQQDLVDDHYTPSNFDKLLEKASGRTPNHYGMTDLYLWASLEKLLKPGDKVLIIGSTIPWYEAMLYDLGCKDITVAEFGPRPDFKEGIRYVHPDDLKGEYDICISISTHEHTGLGRYGDPLDPDGDIKAIEELRKSVKRNGYLLLAVPVGQDTLVWNAHRIYGKNRLQKLIGSWALHGVVGFDTSHMDIDRGIDGSHQPVFALYNEDTN